MTHEHVFGLLHATNNMSNMETIVLWLQMKVIYQGIYQIYW